MAKMPLVGSVRCGKDREGKARVRMQLSRNKRREKIEREISALQK